MVMHLVHRYLLTRLKFIYSIALYAKLGPLTRPFKLKFQKRLIK
ncbi:MAG: hypothetical protein ACI9J3_002769, partial [Parvicellaceae bacterium]